MKTIVLQSFRRHDVPAWLQQCMASVARWAEGEGWDYECVGDTFFTFAPDWVRDRCGANIYAVTDVCRLQWLTDKLAAGYERVVWADADLLVFAPRHLDLRTPHGHGFAHELFLQVASDGRTRPLFGLNNALMVFEAGQEVLPRYLQACLSCLRALPAGPVPRTALGPALLERLNAERPFHALPGVGLFTLALMREIAAGPGPLMMEYLRLSPAPLGAANLCHFLRNATPVEHRPQFDLVYDTAVRQLLARENTK